MKKAFQILKDLNEEQLSLLGFGGALILLLTLIYFAFVPLMEEALFAKEKAAQLKGKLAAYEDLAQRKDYEKITASQNLQLLALEKRLPRNLQQATVMEELHAAAEGCGVRLGILKAVRQGSGKKQGVLLQMECKGSYEGILKFLRRVENEGGFKSLQDFIVKGEEQNGSLELTTMVLAYKN